MKKQYTKPHAEIRKYDSVSQIYTGGGMISNITEGGTWGDAPIEDTPSTVDYF